MRLVALDIGSSALKAVEVKNPFSHRPMIVRAAIEPISQRVIDNGRILDTQELSQAMRRLWKHSGFHTNHAIIAYDGPRTMVRPITLPLLPLGLLRESLSIHAASTLPLPVDRFVLDFSPLRKSKTAGMVDGFLTAIESDVADALVNSCFHAGIDVRRIDLGPFAIARMFQPFYRGSTTAVLDIGSAITDIVIVNGDGLPLFMRTVQTGGTDITDNLCEILHIDVDEAERLKREVGLKPVADPALTPASKIIRKSMGAFVIGVKNTLNYYETSDEGLKIQKIMVTGGTSEMEGLTASISMATGIEADRSVLTRGRSAIKLRLNDKEQMSMVMDDSVRFTTAFGLVLGKDVK